MSQEAPSGQYAQVRMPSRLEHGMQIAKHTPTVQRCLCQKKKKNTRQRRGGPVHTWPSVTRIVSSLIDRPGAINTRNPHTGTSRPYRQSSPQPHLIVLPRANERVAPILRIPTLSLRAQTPPLPNLPQHHKQHAVRPSLAADERSTPKWWGRRTLTQGIGVHGPDRRHPRHGRRRLACRERPRKGRALRRARPPRPAVPPRPRVPRPAPCRLLL